MACPTSWAAIVMAVRDFPSKIAGVRRTALIDRIVVVTGLGRFDFDVLHVEPIEQMPGQFSPGARIVGTGRTMLGKHPPGPELRSDKDQTDDDQE